MHNSSVGKTTIKKDRILQIAAGALFAVYSVILFLERYWESSSIVIYSIIGLAAFAVILFCIFYGSLYRNIDVWLIILLFFFIYVGIVVNYGFSPSENISRFYCIWGGVFALYFIVQIAPDRKRIMRVFSAVSVLPLGYICVSVILNASHAICKGVPPHDTFKGSFEMGRLCGLYNSNVLGIASAALILIGIYGLLRAKKWFRLYYAAGITLGWFTLGLTNSRTAIIGVSVAVSLLIVFVIQRKLLNRMIRHTVMKWILSAAMFIGITLLLIMCFYLPRHIYCFTAELYGNWKNKTALLNNITALKSRNVFDDDTLIDRVYTWGQSLRIIFSSPRRWLFGVSPISAEGISGVYAGHHEILAVNAHNILIEVLRLYGVIGLVIWSALVTMWCRAMLQVFRNLTANVPDLFLTAAVAGMLVMGITEANPFLGRVEVLLSVPFVVMCSNLINRRSTGES